MHTLYLGLGSNTGHRHALIKQAIQLLDERVGTVQRCSTLIETEPWGFSSPNKFLNGVCCLLTDLTPHQCLEATQQIERDLGRTQKSHGGRYHDRPIDIDLLLYDDLQLDTPDLTLPHPLMHQRPFVMEPLQEILHPDENNPVPSKHITTPTTSSASHPSSAAKKARFS